MIETSTPVMLTTGPAILTDGPHKPLPRGYRLAQVIDEDRRNHGYYVGSFGYHMTLRDRYGRPVIFIFSMIDGRDNPPGCNWEDVLMGAMKAKARTTEGGPLAICVRVELCAKNDGRVEWLQARGFEWFKSIRPRPDEGTPASAHFRWFPEGYGQTS